MTQGHEDRRLMAILFTDIAGYTTLTERAESTAIRVRERHRALVRTLAATSLGAQALKNVTSPVNVFALAGVERGGAKPRSRPRLATLAASGLALLGVGWLVKGAGHATTVFDPRTVELVTQFLSQAE